MRLIKQDTDFLPFPYGFDLALAHTILQNDSCACEYSFKLTTIPIENQLADILTKPLDGSRFEFLHKAIASTLLNSQLFP
jgi:hypothetical protein